MVRGIFDNIEINNNEKKTADVIKYQSSLYIYKLKIPV